MALGKRPSVRQEALFVAAAGGAGCWGGGSGVRQGLSLEQDDDGVGGPRAARLRERARARSAELEAEQGSPEAGLCEPAADSGRARQGAAEDAGREARALVRAPAGDGRASPRARSRPRGHPQADADSRRRLQPRTAHAKTLRRRHASGPAGPPRRSASCARFLRDGRLLLRFAPILPPIGRSRAARAPLGAASSPIPRIPRVRAVESPVNARVPPSSVAHAPNPFIHGLLDPAAEPDFPPTRPTETTA